MSPILDNSASQKLGINMDEISMLTQDSRFVEKGAIFAAVKGANVDGRDYIGDAVEKGARIILTDSSVTAPSTDETTVVISDNPRKDFSLLAAEFYKDQPEHIIAVTGTNGKSSVVFFIDQILSALGASSTFIGTLSGNMTTPDPVNLHKLLAKMSEDGITHVAMEASSHGLDQFRLDGVHLDVAAFTSFSQDHLDYHDSMESYLAAKARLFSEVLPISATAVLNADSIAFDDLSSVCKRRGIKIISYGEKGQDIKLLSRSPSATRQEIEVEVFGDTLDISLPLVGRFQVMNVLCALGCIYAKTQVDTQELVTILSNLEGVPGRLQYVTNDNHTRNAYVDYAHTPDALENVLEALRPHTKGKLISLFGCGGDRDTDKRPKMGEVSARLADVTIITDDNPRSEEPQVIRKDILEGVNAHETEIHEIDGRHKAIEFAISNMTKDDVLLVAGKGHEQGQIFNGFTEPFDDVCEVLNAMRKAK